MSGSSNIQLKIRLGLEVAVVFIRLRILGQALKRSMKKYSFGKERFVCKNPESK